MKRSLLAFLLLLTAASTFGDEVVRCESKGGRRRCTFETPGSVSVEVKRQLSITECAEGTNWGYDRDGIWVDRGCRADFFVPARRDDYGRDEHDRSNDRDRRRSETIVCESRNGNTEICEIDTRRGVELSRQLSGAECVFRRTWGYNDRGVWVKDGCRAEFVVGTH